jgi:hypothetical protein
MQSSLKLKHVGAAPAFSPLEAEFFAREAELQAAPPGDDAALYADDARALERTARGWRRLKLLGAAVTVAAIGAFMTIRAGTTTPAVAASVVALPPVVAPAPVPLPAPVAPAPEPLAGPPEPVAAEPEPVAPTVVAAHHHHHHHRHHHGSRATRAGHGR